MNLWNEIELNLWSSIYNRNYSFALYKCTLVLFGALENVAILYINTLVFLVYIVIWGGGGISLAVLRAVILIDWFSVGL